MKISMIAATFGLSLVVGGVCHAESVAQMAQSAINAEGKACASVTATNVLGTDNKGIPLISAACSNGSQHVLKILPSKTLDYYMTCGVFNSFASVKCF